ncbi:MAG: cysteine synthase family protein [Bacteroidota bacterium]
MNITAKKGIDYTLYRGLERIGERVGNTPLFPIERIFSKPGVKLFAKLEWEQIGASVKARAAYSIIRKAVLTGKLHKGNRLIDATSGNTGIAYASICAGIGLDLTIVIPENASKERIQMLRALGADLIFTSKFDGTDGAQEKAKVMAMESPGEFYYADQYNNAANWQAHEASTAIEICAQTKGEITHFVAGLGTTGTFVGTSRGLQKINDQISLISLQPETALHGMEGWKHLETAKVPGIYDDNIAHANLEVSTLEAYELIREMARKEGMLISPSSAANLVGALRVANSIERGVVVTMFPDDASKYSEVLNHVFAA